MSSDLFETDSTDAKRHIRLERQALRALYELPVPYSTWAYSKTIATILGDRDPEAKVWDICANLPYDIRRKNARNMWVDTNMCAVLGRMDALESAYIVNASEGDDEVRLCSPEESPLMIFVS
jgi:hypothetical protein